MKNELYKDLKKGYPKFKKEASIGVFAIACAVLFIIITSSIFG
ncbi:hypothetical protein [Erwinia sp. OPT-41]|uniref:Uncharacterized protein n=1 Tax=Erwinia plantamica TaxID=3237104 RepID=A0ABW7CLN3_9GAMM